MGKDITLSGEDKSPISSLQNLEKENENQD